MINLKSEKGSITLFVLTSCIFFMATIACSQIYMQSKQVAVDREYRQIKANYEASLLNDTELQQVYENLSQIKNIEVSVTSCNYYPENNKLAVKFSLGSNTIQNITNIKYGWGEDTSISTVSNWTYIENESIGTDMIAVNNNADHLGEYYLFLIVNDRPIIIDGNNYLVVSVSGT